MLQFIPFLSSVFSSKPRITPPPISDRKLRDSHALLLIPFIERELYKNLFSDKPSHLIFSIDSYELPLEEFDVLGYNIPSLKKNITTLFLQSGYLCNLVKLEVAHRKVFFEIHLSLDDKLQGLIYGPEIKVAHPYVQDPHLYRKASCYLLSNKEDKMAYLCDLVRCQIQCSTESAVYRNLPHVSSTYTYDIKHPEFSRIHPEELKKHIKNTFSELYKDFDLPEFSFHNHLLYFRSYSALT